MLLEEITPVILTFNEDANIKRALTGLKWARQIVVVDSFSTDSTVALLAQNELVRLFQRNFDSHAEQWNYAINETAITTEWFLALDADYMLDDSMVSELKALQPVPETEGYSARFRYCIAGVPLRGSLYPPVTVLCRRSRARYIQEGHTQRVVVGGKVLPLNTYILHDDRKSLTRWIASQQRYAELEAEHLLARSKADLGLMDRIRLWSWAAPMIVFVYTLMVKRCVFSGWRGLFYALQRTFAEVLLSLEILDRRLAKSDSATSDRPAVSSRNAPEKQWAPKP